MHVRYDIKTSCTCIVILSLAFCTIWIAGSQDTKTSTAQNNQSKDTGNYLCTVNTGTEDYNSGVYSQKFHSLLLTQSVDADKVKN